MIGATEVFAVGRRPMVTSPWSAESGAGLDVAPAIGHHVWDGPHTDGTNMHADRTLGFVLIGIGAVLLLGAVTDIGGEMVPGLIGLGFLAAYVRTRVYGFLVPGGILTGLGAGLVLDGQGVAGDVVPLGLGLGFLAIAVVGRFTGEDWPGWWWPLIPGGILTVVGTSGLADNWDLGRYVIPAVLIVIGASLLFRRPDDRRAAHDPSRDRPPRHATHR